MANLSYCREENMRRRRKRITIYLLKSKHIMCPTIGLTIKITHV